MKAMELREWTADSIVLAERPKPVLGPGQVLIRMQAASLNFRDTVMAKRGYGRRSGNLPLVLVSDGAGIVEAVGDGVTRVKAGDLVCPAFSQTWLSGTFSEAVWPGTLERSIRAVRPSGIVSLIGVLAGGAGELNLGPVVTQNIRLQGITVGSRDLFEAMNRALALHKVKPPIDDKRFAFDGLRGALKAFPEGKHFGKVVCAF